jgi:hypothetical protein
MRRTFGGGGQTGLRKRTYRFVSADAKLKEMGVRGDRIDYKDDQKAAKPHKDNEADNPEMKRPKADDAMASSGASMERYCGPKPR